MHGGAKGSGAPRGNTNALKHGAYTREALERRAQLRGLLREARQVLKELRAPARRFSTDLKRDAEIPGAPAASPTNLAVEQSR